MNPKKVLIVGSGLGGLSTALRLATKGFDVTIVEKYNKAGGRLNILEKDGFKFDLGPTFFSMSYEFDELIKNTGIEYPFEFIELEPLFTVNIDGIEKTFTIYKDIHKLAAQFKTIEPEFIEKMERHLKKTETLYNDTVDRIIHRNFNSFPEYLLQLIRVPIKHGPLIFKTLWTELCNSFESKEARMIFSLVGFFLGATPFDTPAIFSLLNYIEMRHDGYHNVKGGMYQIVIGLLKVLNEKGVKIHYNTEITSAKLSDGKLMALTDSNGHEWKSDFYIINADAAWFRGNIFKRAKYSPKKLDKYYYVNIPSKNNPESAPENHESLFILCPSPDLRFKPDWSDSDTIAQNIIDDLSKRSGYNLNEMIVSKTILTPEHWKDMFNLYKGSGLGLAHDMNQIGWFRPANKDEKFNNVYYVGASTIPGTGLPMAIISSKLTTERIINDLQS